MFVRSMLSSDVFIVLLQARGHGSGLSLQTPPGPVLW